MPTQQQFEPKASATERNKLLKDSMLKEAQRLEQENPNLKLINDKGELIAPNSEEAKTNRDGTPVVGVHPNATLFKKTYETVMSAEKPSDFNFASMTTEGEKPQARVTKNAWVNARATDLQAKGLSPAQAKADAELEYEKEFMQPLKPSFGDYGDRKTPALMPTPVPATSEDTSIVSAFKPQAFLGEAQTKIEKARQMEAGSAGVVGSQPFDFKKLNSQLQEGGLNADQAAAFTDGYRALYNKNYSIYKDSKKAWEETVKSVNDIDNKIKNKNTWIKDPTKVEGAADLESVFRKQIVPGAGVPDFTDDQILFLKEKRKTERAIVKEKVRKETVPTIMQTPPLRGATPVIKQMTPQDIEAWRAKREQELLPAEVYEDDAQLEKIKKGIVEFKPGFLEERNNFGGTRETSANWLLRMSAAGWNAAAGALIDAAPELTYGFTDTNVGDQSFAQEMKAKEKSKAEGRYKDSPVLANIAEGKGLGGEYAEAAQTMWGDDQTDATKNDLMFQLLKTAYVAGGYAGDFLDPTFELAGGTLAGGAATARYAKAAKAAKIGEEASFSSKALKALGYGAGEGAKYVAREVMFGLGSDIKAFAPGDVRSSIAGTLSKELSAQAEIKKAIDAGEDYATALRSAGLDDTAFAKAFDKEARRATSLEDAYKNISRSDDAARQVDEAINAIDELAKGNVAAKAAEKDVARHLGALSRDNPSVYAKLKQVDAAAPKTSKLVTYISELNPKDISALKARLINDIARKEVYKMTGTIAGADNYIQLTRNSFTSKAKGKEILDKVAKSEIGKLAEQLKKANVRIAEVPVERGAFKGATDTSNLTTIGPIVDLTADQANLVINTLRQLANFNVLPADTANIIKEFVKYETAIPLKDFRKMIDAEIDLVAESQKTIVRARDMNLLSDPQKTERLLQPLETKHFGSNLVVDWATKHFNEISGAIKQTASPAQRTILQQAMQKSANLDSVLRSSMSSAMNNPAFRAAYGMARDTIPTKQTALAFIIAGPETGRSTENIASVLESTIQASIFEKTSKEAIFDQVTGAKSFRDNSIFNKEGCDLISAVVDDAAKKIAANPSTLWEEMANVIEFSSNLSKDKAYLKNAIDESKITRVVKDKIPGEIQVGAFYRAEMDRIAKESMQELVAGPAKIASPTILQNVSPAAKTLINDIVRKETARLKGLAQNLLEEQANVQVLKGTLAEERAAGRALRGEAKTLGQAIKEEKAQVRLTAAEKKSELKKLISDENIRIDTIDKLEERKLARAELRNSSKAERQAIKDEATAAREELAKVYAQKRAEVARGISQRKQTTEVLKGKTEAAAAARYNLKQEDIARVEKVISNQSIGPELIGDLVQSRLVKNISGEDITALDKMSIQDIAKTLPDSWKEAALFASKDELMEIITSADDTARSIQAANNIPANGSTDDISRKIANFFQDPNLSDEVRLFFGDDLYKQINESIGQGGKRLNKSLEDLVAREYGPNQSKIKKGFYATLEAVESIFYTFMLTAASRFHGGNVLGAPGILYKTLGNQGLRSLKKYPAAAKMMFDGKMGKNLARVAVKDPAGRAYTVGELYKLLTEVGTKSQFSRSAVTISNDMIRLVSDNPTLFDKFKNAGGFIGRAAEAEDMSFRAAVLLKAIEDGRSIDEAVKLSRAALYDLGDVGKIAEFEKNINALTVFYNFTRNNVINTLELITSPKGLDRIAKYTKMQKLVEGTPFDYAEIKKEGITSKEKAMMSEYAQSRIILDTVDIGEDKYAIAYAPDAMLDSLNFISGIIEGELMDKIFKMARPAIAEQLQDIEGKEAKKIEPEIAAAVDIMPDAVRSRMLKMLTGSEEIQPQIVEGKDGNIETVYPLTKPSERSKYNTFKDYLNYAGFARIISDYAKIFGVEGTSTARIGWGPLARIAGFGSAAITPLKIANAEKTALYNTIAQTEEGKKFVQEIDKLNIQAPSVATEEQQNKMSVLKEKEKQAISRIPKSKMEIYNALDNYDRYIDNLVRSGKIGTKEAAPLMKAFKDNGYVEPPSSKAMLRGRGVEPFQE